MPFDNPYHTPSGDAELLRDARSRVSSRSDWVQGRFQDGNCLCLVGALSLVSGSRSFNTPNQVERRLAGSLFSQLFHQRDMCGCGSGSSPRGSDLCGSTMPTTQAMRT